MSRVQLRYALLLATLGIFVNIGVGYYAFHNHNASVGIGTLVVIAFLFATVRVLSNKMDALDARDNAGAEYIWRAAIKLRNGRIYPGAGSQGWGELYRRLEAAVKPAALEGMTYGFQTNYARFVSGPQATDIARKAGQVSLLTRIHDNVLTPDHVWGRAHGTKQAEGG